MPGRRTLLIIGACCLAAALLYGLRTYLTVALLAGAVLLFIPVLVIALLIVTGVGIRFLGDIPLPTGIRNLVRRAPAEAPPIGALAAQLQTAYRRNKVAEIDRLLAGLPDWPISDQLRTTARALLTFEQRVYRARSEGVPEPMVRRYLANTQAAADSLWRLASQIDALGQHPTSYELIASRLEVERAQLAQLASSAQAAEEGLALLIVSGMQQGAFTRVDADLTDLTAALKVLAQTEERA